MHMLSRFRWFAFLLSIVAISYCTSPNAGDASAGDDDLPDWLIQKIEQIQAQQPRIPDAVIYRSEYKSEIVYFIPQSCCDRFSELYSASGELLCHPDGGITGNGDGRCSDFDINPENMKEVWRDTRIEG